MPTSTEVIRAKRAEEAWAAQMAQVRAAEAAKASVQPAPEQEPAAQIVGTDGQPLVAGEPADG